MPAEPDPYLIDDENPELAAEDFRRMRPASEVLPPQLYASLVARYEPRQSGRTEAVVIDLDSDVVAKLKSAGDDWKAQASALLRKAVGL